MTKYENVRNHILSGQPITALQSLKLYGLQRLAPLINRMRNEGKEITTIMVEEPDGTRYAKYYLPISKRHVNFDSKQP